jgi:MFS family permease
MLADGGGGDGSPGFTRPSRGLLIAGAVCFCAMMMEGVLNDWGAVYLRHVSDASESTAAAGFAVFSGGMVVGRLAADRLRHRVGNTRFLYGSALTSLAASVFAVADPRTEAVLGAYGVLGLGLAAVIPVVFGEAARRHPDRPGPAIAAVSMIGYAGFLSGPPVIGLISGVSGLRTAFTALAVLSLVVLFLTPRTVRR